VKYDVFIYVSNAKVIRQVYSLVKEFYVPLFESTNFKSYYRIIHSILFDLHILAIPTIFCVRKFYNSDLCRCDLKICHPLFRNLQFVLVL